MTDRSTISYISSLLKNPGSLQAADGERIAAITARYPYFAPARYLAAAASNKAEPFTAAMLSSIYPYQGNWLQLCDMLNASRTKSANLVAEKKPEPTAVAVAPVVEAVVEQPQPVQPAPILVTVPEETVAAEIITAEEMEEVVPGETVVVEEVIIIAPAAVVEEELILPIYTEDYFRQQGVKVANEIPAEVAQSAKLKPPATGEKEDQALMVVMSFAEWLLHFKNTAEKQKEEQKDQKALKTMWQKEKLAAAMEEENEEIPENVFEMAVKSISREDGLASESLADVYIKQKKFDKAIEMYRKLSLQNPKKSTYFASKIEEILKEKQS